MEACFSSNKTTLEDVLNLKKEEIIRYLRCKQQKISGNKQEIATRALTFHKIECNVHSPSSPEKPSRIICDENVPSYEEMLCGWTSDLKSLPKVAISDIENYLINSSHRTTDTSKMECYRQYIRGLNFCKEKYIHKIMINTIADTSKLCYVRSKCLPSMKDGVYVQWILMSKDVPMTILKASCTCPAGLGEGCTHIAGLLFAMEEYRQTNDDQACTSKPCEWNKPSKRKHSPKKVENITFKKIKLHSEHAPKNRPAIVIPEMSELESFRNKLCGRLGNANAVLHHLIPPVCSSSDSVESDINVATEVTVDTTEHIIYASDRYLNMKNNEFKSTDEFDSMMNDCNTAVIDELEERTRGQGNNDLWLKARCGRLTASIFHDVLVRRTTNAPCKLVDRIIDDSNDKKCFVSSLKWGRKMEPVAKKQYKAIHKLKKKQTISIVEKGLVLSKHYAYIGASPDGVVVKHNESHLIEVKCPYKWRYRTVKEACSDKDFFCYLDKDGEIQVKKSSRYYTQVQGQMGVCGFTKCDLVVYTTKDLKIISIQFDKDFWENLLKKLVAFYRENVVPKLLC